MSSTDAAPIARQAALLTDRNLEEGRGDQVALVDPAGGQHTFADVHAHASRTAERLRDLGVTREQRVVLVMDDSPRFHAAFLGAMRLGAVPVPVNFLARSDDFRYFMADSYATVVVADAAVLDDVRPHTEALGITLVTSGAGGGDRAIDDWIAAGVDHVDAVDTHPDDMAFWLYSSGSTGRPKGVVHTHKDIAFTARNYAQAVLGLSAEDRVFSTTKLFHAYGLGNGLTFPLYVGARAAQLAGRPTPDACLEVIDRTRPSVLFSVPALYLGMLESPRLDEVDTSSIRIGASAAEALPPEVLRRWRQRTGTDILDGVGSTEMLHIYCSNRPDAITPGTSGVPVPGYELQLRDVDTGEVVEAVEGEEAAGVLWVRGGSALAHYWHQSAATRDALHGQWFHSGDRYRRRPDGTYAYEGRADDMMKVKGLWVSPIEIENRLMEHEAVSEVAVVGVDDDRGMTRVRAHVILTEGHEGGEALTEQLQTWCRDALLRYQYPHVIDYVEDFPRTPTGKIQRFRLRADG